MLRITCRMDNKRKTSVSFMAFRAVLALIGIFTVLDVSHGIRYALVGVMLAIVLGEWLFSRHLR